MTMPVTIAAKNVEITPALQEYCEEKFNRLARYDGEILKVHCHLERSQHHRHGEVYTIAVDLHIPSAALHATVEAGDSFAAVDLVQEKLERELEHARGRSDSRQRRLSRLLSPRNVSTGFRRVGHLSKRHARWLLRKVRGRVR